MGKIGNGGYMHMCAMVAVSTRLVYGTFQLECITLGEGQCATHIVP